MLSGIIMAGGIGKRFWPVSRISRPKQFLNLYGEKNMLQMTFDRLQPIIKKEDIFVITNKNHVELTSKNLPDIPAGNVVGEPLGRDTAPCIGLSAILALNKDPDAVQVVLPADHLITNVDEFQRIIQLGAELASDCNCLITIGIEPTRPETGYGYIQYDDRITDSKLPEKFRGKDFGKVKAFAEKPNLATAKRFIESGDFLWNSGIFIWKASAILNEIGEHLPDLYDSLFRLEDHVGKPSFEKELLKSYREIKSISIDYGVMEAASHVYVIKGDLGWSDVGSWEEYYKLNDKDRNGNVVVGECEMLDATNNLIISDDILVAAIGLDDFVIVNSGNAILICPKDRTQDIKGMVDKLNKQDLTDYL
ncbi:MAG: NTP transferase domain-containing protein [bacterium]|nr:NTP transferase domain-containing protein [bacterium]